MATRGTGLSLHAVDAGYGAVTVLRDVSLDIGDGEVVALLGPNGAGKTTLLRSVFGLTDISAGAITFDGLPLRGHSIHRVAALGLCHVGEGRAVFRGLTVGENLHLFAGGRAPRDALERVFSTFPVLGERRRQMAGTLSGGEQQMLALARALIGDHRLLLADELSMGLAPIVIDLIFDTLAALKAEGLGILVVEQYTERALSIADRVYVLTGGTIAFSGTPDELTSSTDLLALYLGE